MLGHAVSVLALRSESAAQESKDRVVAQLHHVLMKSLRRLTPECHLYGLCSVRVSMSALRGCDAWNL